MELMKIELEIPKDMEPYVISKNGISDLRRNAMLLYPYILDQTISHGKAAEILGIHKLDLIDLYGQMGFSYFDMTMEELDQDIETFRTLRGVPV